MRPNASSVSVRRCVVVQTTSSLVQATNRGPVPPQDLVLGIDFGGTKVALCVDDAGRVIASDRIPIRLGDSARTVVDRTITAVKRMLDACLAPVIAVGIVTPGIVHDHRIELAPNVDGWSELSLRDRFVDGLGISLVVVGNDVKAAALAEATTGALAGVDPGLYLNLGTGIAAAIVVNGTVVQGAHGASGEIGYGTVGASGELDWSGRGAPLEQHVGGRGLGERGSQRFGTDGSARSILDLARTEAAASMFLRERVDELARHVLTCALLLDPQRVVVGGGMSRATKVILNPLRARLESAMVFPPEVVESSFGADASLRGAVELARRAVATDHAALHVGEEA